MAILDTFLKSINIDTNQDKNLLTNLKVASASASTSTEQFAKIFEQANNSYNFNSEVKTQYNNYFGSNTSTTSSYVNEQSYRSEEFATKTDEWKISEKPQEKEPVKENVKHSEESSKEKVAEKEPEKQENKVNKGEKSEENNSKTPKKNENEEQSEPLKENEKTQQKTNVEAIINNVIAATHINEKSANVKPEVAMENVKAENALPAKIINEQTNNIAEVATQKAIKTQVKETPVKQVNNELQQEQAVKNVKPEQAEVNKAIKPEQNQKVMVQIAENQIPQEQFETAKKDIVDNIKLQADITRDLKPQVTKIQVQNTSKEGLNDNQSGNQQFQNNNVKLSTNFQNLSSDVARIQFEKTNQFDKVLTSARQTPAQTLEKSVLNQVSGKNLAEAIQQNKSEVTIILKPANLGKVDINLVSEKGQLTAQITAENTQVKEILSKGLDSLKQNLQDQGVNVSNLVIKVQESSQTQNNQNQFQSDQRFDQANHQNMANSQSNLGNGNNNTSGSNQMYNENVGVDADETAVKQEESLNKHEGIIDYTV